MEKRKERNQVLLKNIFFASREEVQKCALDSFYVSSSVANNRRREIFPEKYIDELERLFRRRKNSCVNNYLAFTCYHRTTLAPTLRLPHVIVVIVILLLRLRMISDFLRGQAAKGKRIYYIDHITTTSSRQKISQKS